MIFLSIFFGVFLFAPAASADPVTAALTASLVSAGLSASVASFIAGAIVNVVGTLALNAVTGALFGKKAGGGGGGSSGFQVEARERTQVIRSSVEPYRFVYGETQVSGTLAFADTSGSSDEYLHLVIPVAGHEVQGIGSVFLNDTEIRVDQLDGDGNVIDGDYANRVRIKKHLGSPNQLADSDLVAEVDVWTSNHRLREIAYLYVRLEKDQNVFPTGIPNVKGVVQGKSLYDPRTEASAFCANTVLAARDYVTDRKGLNAREDELPAVAFAAGANICDEFVDVTADPDTFTVDVDTNTLIRDDVTVMTINRGDRVELTTTDTLPGGLVVSTDYFVVPVAQDRFKLATSYANAFNGTAITISDTGTGTHTVDKTGQVRYDCHGTVTTEDKPIDVIEDMMTSMAGAFIYTQGTYIPYPGASNTSSHDIDADWLDGGIRIKPRVQRQELFNAVRGTFVDPARFWQPTDFPPRENVLYEIEDGGRSDQVTVDIATDTFTLAGDGGWFRNAEQVVFETDDTLPGGLSLLTGYWLIRLGDDTFKVAADKDGAVSSPVVPIDITDVGTGTHKVRLAQPLPRGIELPFTQDATRAQRIANIHLEKGRQGATIEMSCNDKAMVVAVWDTADLNFPELGYANKKFRVIDWRLNDRMGFDLTLQEEADESYDWNSGQATFYDPAPDTNLAPALTATAPTNLVPTSGTNVLDTRQDGTVFSRIKLSWTPPADAFVTAGGRIEVQYKKSASTDWQDSTPVNGASATAFILDVQDGVEYDVQIRSRNSLGVPSDWVTVTNHPVLGKTANPSVVPGFSAQQTADGTVAFGWGRITDADRAGYTIKRHAQTSAPDWDDMTLVTEEERGTSKTDASVPPGDWTFAIKAVDTSGNESTTATTFDLIVSNTYDVVATITDGPRWPGTVTGMVRHGVSGKLIPQSTVSAGAPTVLGQLSVNTPVADTYYEANELDLGFDADDVRVWSNVSATASPAATANVTARLEIDFKDNADSYTGFNPWTLGLADFRQLKARCISENGALISGFGVNADVPEHESVHPAETISATTGTTIIFNRQFHRVPRISELTAAKSGGAPRLANYSNVTTTSVDVDVFDKDGTNVGGTVNVTAIGP